MKNKFVAILACACAAMLCLAFVGCAGGVGGSTSTRYVGSEIQMAGINMAFDEVYNTGENYADLNDDGTCAVCLDGDVIDGTYTINGEDITVTLTDATGDYDCPGTLIDGTLTIDLAETGLNLVFLAE